MPATPDPTPHLLTPGGSSLRHAVERRSAAIVVYLRGLPRALPAVIVLAVAAGGVLAPAPAGGVLLLVVAAVLGWLAFLSWPALPPPGRAMRVLATALVLALAVTRL